MVRFRLDGRVDRQRSGAKLLPVNTQNCSGHNFRFGLVGIEHHFGELFCPTHTGIFHQNLMRPTDLLRQMGGDAFVPFGAKAGGAIFY